MQAIVISVVVSVFVSIDDVSIFVGMDNIGISVGIDGDVVADDIGVDNLIGEPNISSRFLFRL